MDWVGTVWFWLGLGLVLLAAEALLPGAFLLWLGFAATALALIVWIFPGMGMLGQSIVFAVLALTSVGIGWKLRSRRVWPSDSPLLNQRSAQLVGRTQ